MKWCHRLRQRKRHGVSTRPVLEQLEGRRVPTITYHGGPLLAQVQVEAAYYGDYWNTPAGTQQASDLNNFAAFLTNSSYMDMLNEYRVGLMQRALSLFVICTALGLGLWWFWGSLHREEAAIAPDDEEAAYDLAMLKEPDVGAESASLLAFFARARAEQTRRCKTPISSSAGSAASSFRSAKRQPRERLPSGRASCPT
jgi:hypothetical protein